MFLADVLGWPGLFIEADEQQFSELSDKYAANAAVQTLRANVTPQNIERLFGRAGVPSEPDLLSIDVDGQDYWVWEALEAYRPRIVVIEYNAVLPPGRQLVQPRGYAEGWDGTDYFGASLDALCALAERKGYALAHTDLAAANAFFVRSDLSRDAVPCRRIRWRGALSRTTSCGRIGIRRTPSTARTPTWRSRRRRRPGSCRSRRGR